MRFPTLTWLTAYGTTVADLGATGIGVWWWRRLGRGQRLIVAWLAASGLADVGALLAGRLWQNSQPVVRVWLLFSVTLAVEALAAFQHSRQRTAILRIVAGCFVVAWLILLVTVEPITRYSAFSVPLHGVIILLAASVTVLRRISLGRRDLLVDPGFLIGIGLISYAVPAALQTLVAQLSLNAGPQHAMLFYALASVASILAVVMFVRAITTSANAVDEGRS